MHKEEMPEIGKEKMDYKITKLAPEDYEKCSNFWNMTERPEQTKKWFDEIVSGNRVVYIYSENGEFLGEGALVFDVGDPDYTIPNKRVYTSHLVVKENRRGEGIGGKIIDRLTEEARKLNFEEMSVGVNIDNIKARHLYEKKGFNEVIFEGEDDWGKYVKLLKKL